MNNVYFDTHAYHQSGIALLKVIDVENILSVSEILGAARGITHQIGHYFDNTERYINNLDILGAKKIIHENAGRAHAYLNKVFKARGK